MTFGYRTAFPAKYQKALYVADNNYGRIIAVHLKPSGSGYVATSWENFIWPKSLYGGTPRMPHNVTDMIVARDGTFYYVIGNRRTQSYLMKATYVGSQPTARVEYRNADGSQDRATRRALEQFHWTRNDPKAVAAAWPHLGSEDRFLRFAARVALETVPADAWKARALAEQDAATAIIAMLALARVGGPAANEELFATLNRFPLSTLSDPLRIQKLRVIEVAVSRNGKPSDAAVQKVIADVDAVFPGAVVRAEHRDVADPRRVQRRDRGREDAAADGAVEDLRGAVRLSLQPPLGDGGLDARRAQDLLQVVQRGPCRRPASLRLSRVVQPREPAAAHRRQRPVPESAAHGGVATLTDAEKADAELAAILNAYRPPPPVAAGAVRRPLSLRRRPVAAAAGSDAEWKLVRSDARSVTDPARLS